MGNLTEDRIVFIGGRQSGKTMLMVAWLGEGERTGGYPFWSRVVLVSSLAEAERLRKGVLAKRFPEEDTYRWVFSVDEWKHARIGHAPEIGIDNIDMVLAAFLGRGFSAGTITAERWE